MVDFSKAFDLVNRNILFFKLINAGVHNKVSTTQTSRGDVFRENYEYLCSQARQVIFGLKHRLKSLGALPPRVLMHMYETLIRPMLVYGSDVRGSQSQGTLAVDKVFFWYMRCILQVKSTTSNIIVVGENGQIPPSISCHKCHMLSTQATKSLHKHSS